MNWQSRIGFREFEIIEYLQEKEKESYEQLVIYFSPRPGVYNEVEYRLQRMSKKGFVKIEKDGSTKVVRLAI